MEIHGFSIYEEYFALISILERKKAQHVLYAIAEYMFKGVEPKLDAKESAVFESLRRALNKQKNKSKNAKKEKSKENQNEIKAKSNEEQKEIKIETQQDVDVNNILDSNNERVVGKEEEKESKEKIKDDLVTFISKSNLIVTPYEFTIIELYMKDFSIEEIKHALILGKDKSINYSLAILKNWFIQKSKENSTSKSNKPIPSWFNETVEFNSNLDSKEMADFDNDFKEFIETFRKEGK